MTDRATPPIQIASLLPSASEIVAALGFRDCLVGRSHECDFPSGIDHLPVLTRSKVPSSGTSADIDRGIKNLVEDALSVYEVDAAGLKTAAPNLIVTQTQCDVCAVSENDVACAIESWTDSSARIVSLAATDLNGLWADIRAVARALDADTAAETLIEQLMARCTEIERVAAALPTRPRVATVEWVDPLMSGGNWVPTLVRMAGGDNLFGASGVHSPWLDWEDLCAADPDVIVIIPCGYDIPRAIEDTNLLRTRPGWDDLQAVRTDNVFVADGNQYFNRPGPRLVESLEIMAEILHPETFSFGHQGAGWVKLAPSEPT
jgi:iron complex transport system substrate-binding protein